MNQNKYFLLWIGFFIAFAAVSCWATAESLHLLLYSWPLFFCWIVTIGFFIVASIGSVLIVNSLNQNIYCEKRGSKLVGGIIIMLIFWLVCSMPTNTHTFFYRTLIDKQVTEDITTTKSYLKQIQNDAYIQKKLNSELNKLDNEVDMKLGELQAEILNDGNPGFGPNARRILNDFASILEVDRIEPLSLGTSSLSKQGRERLSIEYRKKIYTLKEARKEVLKNKFISPEQGMKDAAVAYKNLEVVENAIASQSLSLYDALDIHEVSKQITTGYVVVKNNKEFVAFNNIEDEARYTSDESINRVEILLSVFDVWVDLFKGNLQTGKFIFWIIISVLVDVAAFIFFDLAFKKED